MSDTPRLPPGSAPVSTLAAMDPVEVGAVLGLRRWCDAGAAALNADLGPGAADHLATLCRLCVGHGPRPLARHAMDCPCVGADEACFARLVLTAAMGEAEDALRIAILMVRPDLSPLAVAAARQAGFALHRVLLRTRAPHRVH